MKRALITGVTGQDGSYLAELLLRKGYEVIGLVRRSSSFNTDRIERIYQDPHASDYRFKLVYGDLEDASSLNRIIRTTTPSEIYNLGAQSHVRVSFDVPDYTADGPWVSAPCACSRHLRETGQKVQACTRPRRARCSAGSPAAAGRDHAIPSSQPLRLRQGLRPPLCENYRESLWHASPAAASSSTTSRPDGETPSSPARSPGAAARIRPASTASCAWAISTRKRDWGYAGDYVEAMWLMLQQDNPDDYVDRNRGNPFACARPGGRLRTLGLDWDKHVEIDPRYFRPTEVDHLCGDASKARAKLGWQPKVHFKELIEMMVKSDEADVRSALEGRAPAV